MQKDRHLITEVIGSSVGCMHGQESAADDTHLMKTPASWRMGQEESVWLSCHNYCSCQMQGAVIASSDERRLPLQPFFQFAYQKHLHLTRHATSFTEHSHISPSTLRQKSFLYLTLVVDLVVVMGAE